MLEGEYKVALIKEFKGKLELSTKKFRPLGKEEVLIKVQGTSIHQNDLMLIRGDYGDFYPNSFPITPGFEGCGDIVKTGAGVDINFVGKRVACSANFENMSGFEGLWSEYFYAKLDNLMIFEGKIPYEKICFTINPLTACAMFDTIKKSNSKSFVLDAADSTLGQMLIKLCHYDNIESINLVKDVKHVDILTDIGCKNIIELRKNWELELSKTVAQIKPTIGFDRLGGSYPGKILKVMPNHSTIYHYGFLEDKEINEVCSKDLIFRKKQIQGWWVSSWLLQLTCSEMTFWRDYVKNELQNQSKYFTTMISKHFRFEEINKAIDYYRDYGYKGKVFIEPFGST